MVVLKRAEISFLSRNRCRVEQLQILYLSMTRWSIVFLISLGSVFAGIALWPLTSKTPSIELDAAYISSVQAMPLWSTTLLTTANGTLLRCNHTKTGGCPAAAMKKLLAEKIPALVWHDGTNVVQLYANGQTLFAYRSVDSGVWFAAAMAFVCFLAAGIQVAISIGLINRPQQSCTSSFDVEAGQSA